MQNALFDISCQHANRVHVTGAPYKYRCPDCGAWLQPILTNPIVHASDPSTSHEAALDVTKSGRRATDAEKVLNAVRSLPGHTSTELADAIPELNLYGVRRRLTDLLHNGSIRRGSAVVRGGERRQVTWWTNR